MNIICSCRYIFPWTIENMFHGADLIILLTYIPCKSTLIMAPLYMKIWLVVSTHLKNISQLGWLVPIYGKIKHVPNHQPENNNPDLVEFPHHRLQEATQQCYLRDRNPASPALCPNRSWTVLGSKPFFKRSWNFRIFSESSACDHRRQITYYFQRVLQDFILFTLGYRPDTHYSICCVCRMYLVTDIQL